jgi:predicted phage terminase large subunit-like protein
MPLVLPPGTKLNVTPEQAEQIKAIQLSADPVARAAFNWKFVWLHLARKKQLPPTGDWNIWLAMAGRGFGKDLCLKTPIPTPEGWTTMGDIRVGDTVFDEAGTPCKVVGKFFPPPSQIYRVTFSDGSSIVAGADHQWVTWTHRDRKQYLRWNQGATEFPERWPTYRQPLRNSWGHLVGECGPSIKTTEEVRATLCQDTARRDLNHCIPLADPLDTPAASLPIDPWVLGYWLANGAPRAGVVCAGSYKGTFDDTHVEAAIRQAGMEVGQNRRRVDRGHTSIGVMGLSARLEAVGVLGNKHIPPAYLRASIQQRLALLRGLCDGDGYGAKSSAEYGTTAPSLRDGVVELLRSLGERPVVCTTRARLNGVDYGEVYRVNWRWRKYNPFSLPRKAELCPPPGSQGLRVAHRMITAIDPVPYTPTACIMVDSPTSMYLAGEAMIPTHNTLLGANWLGLQMQENPGWIGHVVAPTHSDLRGVCFEGASGLLGVIPEELIASWNKSISELKLKNGSIIRGFSADVPNRLRGPQCGAMWADEVAAWQNAQEAFDMAMFGLRLGQHPRAVLTTTPRPIPLIKSLMERQDCEITTGSTYENRANLAPSFFGQIAQYEGTTLGRQELYAEIIDSEEFGVLKREWFDLWPTKSPLPPFEYVIQSYDTAYSMRDGNDPTACITLGVYFDEKKRHNRIMLLDAWDEMIPYPDLRARAQTEYNARYGDPDGDGGRKCDLVLIEDKAVGTPLATELQRAGIPVRAYNPGRADKLQRLHAISHLVMNRMVVIPESVQKAGSPAKWADKFLYQVCAFNGEGSVDHDDYVDCLSQALTMLRDMTWITLKDDPEDDDEDQAPPEPRVNPYAC